jgi:D-alanyl-D-alanine dipeptidase
VDLAGLHPAFIFDLRYASADNFVGKAVYPVARCALRKSVAERMVHAQKLLAPKYRLIFKDCYRPDSIQWELWRAVKGTPKSSYVACPAVPPGSMHSYGVAVDVTLADRKGRELDLGTPYDTLGPAAELGHERELRASGELSEAQLGRRWILRQALRSSGMHTIPSEWWHFDAGLITELPKTYSRLDVPLEAIPVVARPK